LIKPRSETEQLLLPREKHLVSYRQAALLLPHLELSSFLEWRSNGAKQQFQKLRGSVTIGGGLHVLLDEGLNPVSPYCSIKFRGQLLATNFIGVAAQIV
jgi:hypothetical protein